MNRLESKIPPPLVMAGIAVLMWAAARALPFGRFPMAVPMTGAGLLAAAGLLIELAGAYALVRARTTVDPTNPCKASNLVAGGVYHYTRNPIYLGDLILLLAWALYLSSLLSLVLAWLFVPYIDRFQITPEERALSELFGQPYDEYRSRVRKWG